MQNDKSQEQRWPNSWTDINKDSKCLNIVWRRGRYSSKIKLTSLKRQLLWILWPHAVKRNNTAAEIQSTSTAWAFKHMDACLGAARPSLQAPPCKEALVITVFAFLLGLSSDVRATWVGSLSLELSPPLSKTSMKRNLSEKNIRPNNSTWITRNYCAFLVQLSKTLPHNCWAANKKTPRYEDVLFFSITQGSNRNFCSTA